MPFCSRSRFVSFSSLPLLFLGLAAASGLHAQVIAVFGDSITAGYGNPNNSSWTTALAQDLPGTYTISPDGITGSTVLKNPPSGPSFQTSTNQATINSLSKNANIVIVMLGTNDSKSANQAATNANFIADYKSLLDEIKANSTQNPAIYLVTPVPAFLNNNSFPYDIDPAYVNGTMKGLVQSLDGYDGAKIIDLNDELKSTFSNGSGGYSTTYLLDGIHPTVAGDQLIAKDIQNVIAAPEPSTRGLSLTGFGLLTIFAGLRAAKPWRAAFRT